MGPGVCQLRPFAAGGRQRADGAGTVFHQAGAGEAPAGLERVQESAEAQNHRQPHTHEQRPGAQAVPGDPRKRGGDHGKTVSGVQGGRGGAVCERLDTGGIFADTAAEAVPMSGKKHCKGVDVVCPFWRCETPLTITCEGWMAGCDVQLRFSGQGEKLAYMRRRCKRMDGWGKCLVAVGAGRKYEK